LLFTVQALTAVSAMGPTFPELRPELRPEVRPKNKRDTRRRAWPGNPCDNPDSWQFPDDREQAARRKPLLRRRKPSARRQGTFLPSPKASQIRRPPRFNMTRSKSCPLLEPANCRAAVCRELLWTWQSEKTIVGLAKTTGPRTSAGFAAWQSASSEIIRRRKAVSDPNVRAGYNVRFLEEILDAISDENQMRSAWLPLL